MSAFVYLLGAVLAVLPLCADANPLHLRAMASSCAACHGTGGLAMPGMESLAGRSKEELLQKLIDYKTGKIPATVMHQLSKGYSDAQLEQLAGFFSTVKK